MASFDGKLQKMGEYKVKYAYLLIEEYGDDNPGSSERNMTNLDLC